MAPPVDQGGAFNAPMTPQQPPANSGFNTGNGGIGFPGAGQPQADNAQQPVRQNYADELTDFGVPPQSTLQQNVGTPTPTTIPGGHVITTNEVRQALGSDILMIDAWNDPSHPSIPGAIRLPEAGSPGSFQDQNQQQLWQALAQMTNRQPQRPMIFFCASSRCWESYNSALRAINMGFKVVLWYRGGMAAWQAAGLPTEPAMQGQSQGQGQFGFQNPGQFDQQPNQGGFQNGNFGAPQGGMPAQGGMQ